jgi:hypothetical protein
MGNNKDNGEQRAIWQGNMNGENGNGIQINWWRDYGNDWF